jgi:hypothetical protein
LWPHVQHIARTVEQEVDDNNQSESEDAGSRSRPRSSERRYSEVRSVNEVSKAAQDGAPMGLTGPGGPGRPRYDQSRGDQTRRYGREDTRDGRGASRGRDDARGRERGGGASRGRDDARGRERGGRDNSRGRDMRSRTRTPPRREPALYTANGQELLQKSDKPAGFTRPETRDCWNCGKPGHLYINCTEPPKPERVREIRRVLTQVGGYLDERGIWCCKVNLQEEAEEEDEDEGGHTTGCEIPSGSDSNRS